jgi:uncharacterized membrane protein YeaQ/YmgE (transglycosylase-associated protein family)
VLILGIIGFGMLIGAIAQLILGRHGRGIDWGLALVAGLVGSFIGGLLFSLIAGDGLKLRPSGIIGSLLGALIITAIWQSYQHKQHAQETAAAKSRARSGDPRKRAGR